MLNMATYHFDTELASIYGVEEAILIYNLQFWINKNKANSRHQYDGRTWTYNSYKAFSKLFPFWNPGKIRRVIKSLVDKGVIVEGNYNKMKADRTKWYAFTEETGPIYKSDSPCVGSDSPCVGSGAPIPDRKHSDNKQHISNTICASELKVSLTADFEECWEQYPSKTGKDNALKSYLKYKPSKQEVLDGIARYVENVAQQRANGFRDMHYANGKTWFNQKRWEDVYPDVHNSSHNGSDFQQDRDIMPPDRNTPGANVQPGSF